METQLHLNQIDLYPSDHEETRELYQFEFVKDETFERKIIVVDNRQFENCVFHDCHFIHSGGHFAFANCVVNGTCQLSPTGAAYKAIRLLEALEPQISFGVPPY